jgi:hypothetical protein
MTLEKIKDLWVKIDCIKNELKDAKIKGEVKKYVLIEHKLDEVISLLKDLIEIDELDYILALSKEADNRQ